MSILDKKHILTIDLDDSSIEYSKKIFFYNTDKNISNLYVKIKKNNDDGVGVELSANDLKDITVKLTAIKPKTNQTRDMIGILTEELTDQSCAIYKFELLQEFTDQVGPVVCEFELSNASGEKVTIDAFSYKIKASKLTGLNAEIESNPDLPVLKQLIKEVKETAQTVNNIDNTNVSDIKTYSNKKIEEKFSTVNSQIKDIENEFDESSTYINTNSKNTKCCITFIDDDGHVNVYNRLLPIFKSKNAKFASCLITDLIGTDAYCMSVSQVKECIENGMETLSHTKNVSTNLTDNYSDSEIIEQLKVSKDWLKNNGFMYEGFVYPQSGYNLKIRKLVKEYYKYAFADMGVNDLGYLDHSRIKRIAFGSWTDKNPTINGNSEKNTLAYYKACVDYAYITGTWLIFMSHINQQTVEQDEILKQLIDYIKSLNIDIVTPSEGFKLKRNQVNVGDLEENYLFIGEEVNTNITGYKFKKSTGFNKDTSIVAYDKNCKTLQFFVNADNGGFPDGSGTLETYRSKEWEGLSCQIFRPYVNSKTYKRVWNTITNTWNSWVWLENTTSPIVVLKYNSVDANTPSSAFENNKISYCQITSSSASNMPLKLGGTLITDKIVKDNGYCTQKYYIYNSNTVYERRILSDGTYSTWIKNNPIEVVTINVPQVIVNANTFVTQEVNCTSVNANKAGVTGNPTWGVTEGILYNVFVKTNGKICISYYNTTATNITLTARDWKFFISND